MAGRLHLLFTALTLLSIITRCYELLFMVYYNIYKFLYESESISMSVCLYALVTERISMNTQEDHGLFLVMVENHQINLVTQGGAEDSVTLVLTKSPSYSFSCPLPYISAQLLRT